MKEKIKKYIKDVLHKYAYETNNNKTRKLVEDELFGLLNIELNSGSFRSFMVRCDEGNNPPEVVDNNELVVDIGFKMTSDDEMTVITGRIGMQGCSFDESL